MKIKAVYIDQCDLVQLFCCGGCREADIVNKKNRATKALRYEA